jgi:hypothetical protein
MAPMFSRWDLVVVMIVFGFRIVAVVLPILLLFTGSKKVNNVCNCLIIASGLILAYRFGTEFLYLSIPAVVSIFIKSSQPQR